MNLAIDWIKSCEANDKPFFAVVWFGSPHGPHLAATEDSDLYPNQPANSRNFLGEVTGMDRAMGELQTALDTMNIRDNTLVWYTSDNGALPRVGSSGGFRGKKGAVYEGGLLVPSIVQWPSRIRRPATTMVRGNTCDILPTLLDVANIQEKPRHELDGISLIPLFDSEMETRDQPMGFWDTLARGQGVPSAKLMTELLSAQSEGSDLKPNDIAMNAARLPEPRYSTESFPGHAAWIDGDWKLHRIEDKQGKVSFELYRLESDPFESSNVVSDHPDKVTSMKTALNEWLESVVDSLNGEDYETR